jgi:SAM-dependent methyltransferase
VGSPDHARALDANRAAYDAIQDGAYLKGAPHLRHPSLRRIYEREAEKCLRRAGGKTGAVTVLELGAGSGLASWPWFGGRVRLTAVDGSAEMLARLRERGREHGLDVEVLAEDVLEFAGGCRRRFDVVTHVSMLHHLPDYLALLGRSVELVAPGGCLLTFQDPLRYDTVPRGHRLAERAAYFAWRLGRGSYGRGLRTRWRRLRRVYSAAEPADFEEYHVVRGGVDADAITRLLRPEFEEVRLVEYWSTYSPLLQALGEAAGLRSSFGVVALGRAPEPGSGRLAR